MYRNYILPTAVADARLQISSNLRRLLFSNFTKKFKSVLKIGRKLGRVQGPNTPVAPPCVRPSPRGHGSLRIAGPVHLSELSISAIDDSIS